MNDVGETIGKVIFGWCLGIDITIIGIILFLLIKFLIDKISDFIWKHKNKEFKPKEELIKAIEKLKNL